MVIRLDNVETFFIKTDTVQKSVASVEHYLTVPV